MRTTHAPPVFVLGGYQTDFARNVTREGGSIADLVRETAAGALAAAGVAPGEIEVGHVGNFAGELFVGQGHLGGLLVEADPAFAGLPTSRHEAACASGGVAVLAAMADIEAGRYDVALVLGVELMRSGSALEASSKLGAAAWVPRETEGLVVGHVWPEMFSRVGDEYERRYGLRREHLVALARSNFQNARQNPSAQTRRWQLGPQSFDADSPENPRVAGRLHKYDCSQVTDGGAAVVLASERFAREHAARGGGSGVRVASRIAGFGHTTSRMALADKLEESRGDRHVFPHVRRAIEQAFGRAGVAGVGDLDVIETHDCFTTTHYMAIDHFGITPPGESWRAIDDGTVLAGGRLPVNPSGGLMGLGHPVGASGVRMLLDAHRQVTGTAGDYQVAGARRAAMLNIGGSATTSVCLLVEA
jgi:acetyl-CoA C-acetyltransferase